MVQQMRRGCKIQMFFVEELSSIVYFSHKHHESTANRNTIFELRQMCDFASTVRQAGSPIAHKHTD
jgi:hypothetical protein